MTEYQQTELEALLSISNKTKTNIDTEFEVMIRAILNNSESMVVSSTINKINKQITVLQTTLVLLDEINKDL